VRAAPSVLRTRVPKHIVAMGGGGFLMEPENPLLDDYALRLTGKARPKVCLIPTASGDADQLIVRFYAAFGPARAEATHLPLFVRRTSDIEALLLSQDLVYVSGGNTANLLAVWRLHGVDVAIRKAWDAGVVLAGVSAGAICWFESSVTDSFGLDLAGLGDGLGFLKGSCCPHYDGEERREPTYRRLIADGFAPGYAIDDYAALHFEGTELCEAIRSRPAARAAHVHREKEAVVTRPIPVRDLGS